MCTSLSVIIDTETSSGETVKHLKKPTKKLDSHLKNNSCATMMLYNNLCYFQVNSYGKKKKTGHIVVL